MSKIDSSTQRLMITLNAQGEFIMHGRAVDMVGLVFQMQEETSKLAQSRLSYTAKELWDANRKTKMITSFLNSVRGIRPTGDSTATVSSDKVYDICNKFRQTYKGDPFAMLGVKDLTPDISYTLYYINNETGSRQDEPSDAGEAKKLFKASFLDSLIPNQETIKPYVQAVKSVYPNDDKYTVHITKKYADFKQAQVDQLIEGLKSKISNIGSAQELLQNDTQRYTRLADETKETMSDIEKTLYNVDTTLDSKI